MSNSSVLTNWKIAGFAFIFTMIVEIFIAGIYKDPLFMSFISILIFLSFVWFVLAVIFSLFRKGTSLVKNTTKTYSSNGKLKRKMLEIMSDGVMTDEEEKELANLAKELDIDESSYNEFRKVYFEKTIQPILKKIEKTKRYSPDDEKAIRDMATDQKVTAKFSDNLFTRYRQLWEIETKGTYSPSPIDADIRLTSGEECYFETPSTWKREKRIRNHKGYIGGSVGLRVAKGVTLRVGRAAPIYDEYDSIEPISSGMLYITNKKIVFVGTKKSTSITFGRFANYELYRDAIQINKTSGPPDIFIIDEDDILLLDALLQVI